MRGCVEDTSRTLCPRFQPLTWFGKFHSFPDMLQTNDAVA